MNVALRVRRLRNLWFVAAVLFVAANAHATFYPGDPDAFPIPTHDVNQGPNGAIVVRDYNLFGGVNPCFYRVYLPPGKVVEEIFPIDILGEYTIVLCRGDKGVAQLNSFDFAFGCPPPAAGAKPSRPLSPQQTLSSIPVSNDADTLDGTCDGRYLVVVGANSTKPVSLVDMVTKTEVGTYTFNGLSAAVSVADDSQSILVHLDTNAGGAGIIRRLLLNGTGFTDTMETLAIGSATVFINKVIAAPGSKTGVVMVTEFPAAAPPVSRLVSFGIPGLVVIDQVTLAGRRGNAVIFNCPGTKIYARSGDRINSDVIEGFGYNPMTGFFTKPASLTINGVSPYVGTSYPNPLALTPNGIHLIASESISVAGAPTPRVTSFDTITGARVNAFTDGFSAPSNVRALPCCLQRKQITSIQRMPNGHVMLQGKVESPNWTFSLQLAPNMSNAFGSPVSITSDANGMFQHDDAGAVGLDKRFYRLTYP